MILRSASLGLGLATAVLMLSTTSFAGEKGPDTVPLHVLTIQSNEADEQADALTKALGIAVRAMPGWSLADGDYSFEVLSLNLKCPDPPDTACQSRIADQIKTDRYVWGAIKKKGMMVAGELNFWVRGKGTTKIPLEYSANLNEANDDALKKIAMDSLTQLTGGPPKGTLHVRAGEVPGQVFIDGQPLGTLTNGDGSFLAPAGSHKITVKAPGYGDSESTVSVRPAATVEVVLAPIRSDSGNGVDFRRVGGYVGIGAGIVSAAVGVVSAIQVFGVQKDDTFSNFRKAHADSPDVCQAAKTNQYTDPNNAAVTNLCNKASTFETVQLVFFPMAAVLGGAGIYLLATSKPSASSPPKTGLTIDPKVGPNGGKLDLSYTF
jgi:hypothetical protein